MHLREYQEKTSETAIYPTEHALWYLGLGLAGEAGEVANNIKKILRDHDGILTEDIRRTLFDELGDCLWYVSELCNWLGYSLEDVLENNIGKLQSRKERGVLSGNGDKR